MVASRIRVVGAFFPARFWLSACCAALMPTSIGYQDLAALIAHERAAAASFHMIASPFGTVQAATFSYSRPVGSAIPEPLGLFQNVNFDPRSLDAFSWKIDEPLTARPARQIEYPSVNRAKKGDRLPAATIAPTPDPASLPRLQPISTPAAAPTSATPPAKPAAPVPLKKVEQQVEMPAAAPAAPTATPDAAAVPVATTTAPDVTAPTAALDLRNETTPSASSPSGNSATDKSATDKSAPDKSPIDIADVRGGSADDEVIVDKPPELPAPGEADANGAPSALDELALLDDDVGDRDSQIYFGGGVMGSPASLQRWAPGAEPILVSPADTDIKLSALEGRAGDTGAGETVAGKGDSSLTGSPAERLGLAGKSRAHAEKCLADAVYFEARGEVVKGQEAVAQVVMNRVFSGYYPQDVCGVVYQNANRHLACQFTFACEGKDLSRIDEPDMWEQAKHIAKDMLDGKIWLAEVGHATHYHAYWVHPSWVHEMARLYKLGVHTFYRPRNWGDGDDEPVWGKGEAAPNTSKAEPPINKTQVAATSAATPRPEAEAKNSDAKTSDAKNSDAESSDAKNSDAKNSDAKPAESKSSAAEASDAKTSDAKTSDAKTSDAKTSDAKELDNKPSEAKSSDAKLSDAKLSDSKAPDSKNSDAAMKGPEAAAVPAGGKNAPTAKL